MSSIDLNTRTSSAASEKKFSSVAPETQTLRGFFDGIAGRYDFLNQFLSFHLDDYWRRKSRKLLLSGKEESVLDLGTGTGKFLELFLKTKSWKRAVGLDFSEGMLCAARRELPSGTTGFIKGDFQALPFAGDSFNTVISAFTLRSVGDMQKFLGEIRRVLTAGGKTGLLCLTRPKNPFFSVLYYPYLKFYLPWVGGLISGNRDAYRFLADSILNFQEPDDTAEMMRRNGFREVSVHRFTFGTATLIVGEK